MDYKYGLPFASDVRFSLGSTPLSNYAHPEYIKDAWDFVLPVGTPLTVTRPGTVILVKDDSSLDDYMQVSEGINVNRKLDLLYFRETNTIIIDHGDDTYSAYVHLMQNSSEVKVGDFVKKGDPLAKSGNTGISTNPHLHYEVFEFSEDGDPNELYFACETQSIPFRFEQVPFGNLERWSQRVIFRILDFSNKKSWLKN